MTARRLAWAVFAALIPILAGMAVVLMRSSGSASIPIGPPASTATAGVTPLPSPNPLSTPSASATKAAGGAGATPTAKGSQATLYVATNGSDANPGTLAQPLRTIGRAVHVALPGGTILVRGGTYFEEVVFDHGGFPGQPIILESYPGESPVLDGSQTVSSWTRVAGTVWKARFTHALALHPAQGVKDAASESTCPDGYQYSGDRRAYLYVDDTPDAAHWLRPLCLGVDPGIATPANLPPGSFATDVAPPPRPSGQLYAGTTNTVYVNLADRSDPNRHQIRLAAYDQNILFWGNHSGDVVLRGLAMQLALGGVDLYSPVNDVALDRLDVSLNAMRSISVEYFCATNWTITNSHIHDIQYEGIHLEADNSTVANNRIENTIAPWSQYGSVGINVLGNDDDVAGNLIQSIKRSEAGTGGYGIFMEEWYNGAGDVGCHAETDQNNLVERNRVARNESTGVYNAGGDRSSIRNNLIYGNGGGGIAVEDGGTGGGPTGVERGAYGDTIYFNTIYGNARNGVSLSPNVHDAVVRDNIIYDNAGVPIYNRSIGATIDHNLTTNPQFANSSAGDFSLRSGSPAIDGGIDVGVANDFIGTARPQGAGFDVGAYELALPASPSR